jgi:hypothetical protein
MTTDKDFLELLESVGASHPELIEPLQQAAARVLLLERAKSIFDHCDVSDGRCCCGDSMDKHPDPYSCGHSPVDHGGYVVPGWLEDLGRLT